MLDAGQGLGEEVRDVEAPRHMLNAELLSLDAVLQPVEKHVDALRQARCDGLVGQAHCDLRSRCHTGAGSGAVGTRGCGE